MIKKLYFSLLFLLTGIFNAQTHEILQSTKDAFKGYWVYKTKYFTNSIAIDFELGKDFALFTNIGTGEAPPRTFQAVMNGNLLIIPAQRHINDYIELEVIKGKLHLRMKQVTWDDKGNIDNKLEEKTIFNRKTRRD